MSDQFSIQHLLLIALIVTLVFGTKKLRNIGTDLGSTVKGYKEGSSGEFDDGWDNQFEKYDWRVKEVYEDYKKWSSHVNDLKISGLNVEDKNLLADEFVEIFGDEKVCSKFSYTMEELRQLFLTYGSSTRCFVEKLKLASRPTTDSPGWKVVNSYIAAINNDEFSDMHSLNQLLLDVVKFLTWATDQPLRIHYKKELIEKVLASVERHIKILKLKNRTKTEGTESLIKHTDLEIIAKLEKMVGLIKNRLNQYEAL